MDRSFQKVLRVGGAFALLGGCMIEARRVDLHLLRATLLGASLWPIGAAILLNVVVRMAARTRRTLIILRGRAEGQITFAALFRLLLAAYAAGVVVIGPAEELLSGAVLVRSHGFGLASIVSAQVTEKLLGVLSIAVLAVPFLMCTGWLKLVGAVATAAALCVAAALVSRLHQTGVLGMVEAFALVCVSNLISVVMIALSLRAVGVRLDLVSCAHLFVLTSTASALPIAPLQLGALESAFVFGATGFGISASAALAAALLYHFAQIAPLALAGLPILLRLTWSKSVKPTIWTGRECLSRA